MTRLLDRKEQDVKTKYETEMKKKEQTTQSYEAFSDSLLTEIKKKESIIIMDFELARPKDSISMTKTDLK